MAKRGDRIIKFLIGLAVVWVLLKTVAPWLIPVVFLTIVVLALIVRIVEYAFIGFLLILAIKYFR